MKRHRIPRLNARVAKRANKSSVGYYYIDNVEVYPIKNRENVPPTAGMLAESEYIFSAKKRIIRT